MSNETALIIVDVQLAMFNSIHQTSVHNAEGVLDNICHLIDQARKSDVPVIFIQHTDHNDEEYAEGQVTWQLHPKLSPKKTEKIIRKATWDAFHQTTLLSELQALNVKNLVFAGMQTEFCLDTTCRRAFSLGFKSVLASDGHSTFDSPVLPAEKIIEHHNYIMDGRFVKCLPVNDIEF